MEALQKKAEDLEKTLAAFKKSEERYQRMVAEVQDYAIILLSKDGTIENWNRGAEKIKGYTAEEAKGQNFRIFYTEEDRAKSLPEKLIQEAITYGRANHEGWRVRKDGRRFWGSVSITALHDDQQNIIGFSKVTRDLTERKAHELKIEQLNQDLVLNNEMLRRSEERYQRMISEVEDYAIVLLSPDGNIQTWNKGAQKIKGYAADEVLGKHFSIFYTGEDRKARVPEKLFAEASRIGKAVHEGWRQKKDGSTFWGTVVITALHNDDGSIVGFTKVTRDLTQKKLAEEEFLAALTREIEQKNEALERLNDELLTFAYVSSHDLQEPLRKIQMFANRIVETEFENLSAKGKDYLKRMEAAALRMQKLIEDIMGYSRVATAEKTFERTDLNNVLGDAKAELNTLITAKRAVIENDPLPTLPTIPFQVQQLFTQLLSNALKFSKKDVAPHIAIRARIVDAERVPVPREPTAKRFSHISFQDNGIGFEKRHSQNIFEIFKKLHSRTEYPGSGIGLAICKKIVENHNGALTAESDPNEGATFHLYLPYPDDEVKKEIA